MYLETLDRHFQIILEIGLVVQWLVPYLEHVPKAAKQS